MMTHVLSFPNNNVFVNQDTSARLTRAAYALGPCPDTHMPLPFTLLMLGLAVLERNESFSKSKSCS